MAKKAFNFGKANDKQKVAIETTEGPLLIIAGPGTGKTFTLVKRVQYLIQVKGVSPKEIFVVTYTEKAAQELVTRISNALLDEGIDVNLSDMPVGTFHGLFGRIITEYIEKTDLKKNYIQLDDYMQKELISKNLQKFKELPHYNELDTLLQKSGKNIKLRRNQIRLISDIVNKYREELVSVTDMESDEDPHVLAVAEILKKYDSLLKKENAMDFSGILVKMYNLLNENPDVRSDLSERYRYIMVDEYQDTNYIQDQILSLMVGESKNLCVVGDDDQSLYRFRGASINNILSFPKRYPRTDGIKPVILETNYRSTSDIIRFYSQWMSDKEKGGADGFFKWKKARYDKKIKSETATNTPSVFKLVREDKDSWYESVYNMIHELKSTGKITDYNQVAFLVSASKPFDEPDRYTELIKYLEKHDIPTYAPRFGLYYERIEIRELIGCLLKTYPTFLASVNSNAEDKLNANIKNYYNACIQAADAVMKKNADLKKWMDKKVNELNNLTNDAHYAFTDMIYQLLEFKPFSEYVTVDVNATTGGVSAERSARNIAIFIDIASHYELINNLTDGFKPAEYKAKIENFFRYYLKDRIDDRTDEYDDAGEYAPHGCVPFMTIHQSKGLEFPIVITASLECKPYGGDDGLTSSYIRPKYYHSKLVEDEDKIKYYDYWRLFYTAFSRAKTLLVLTMNERLRPEEDSFCFKNVFDSLPDYTLSATNGMVFDPISISKLKNTYSFTTHLGVYETCPKQYYFFRKLGFAPCRTGNALFGTLVHETIEDINKAAIAGSISEITPENVELWMNSNYTTLMNKEHYSMSQSNKNEALRQLLGYVDYASRDWSLIKETEVEVKDIRPEYILLGKVDLVQGDGDTYELVDFKTGDKPGPDDDSEQLKHYKEQLITYSHLVSQRTGKKISKAHLHYTKVTEGDPRITIDVTDEGIAETMDRFRQIVRKIESDDFSGYACDTNTCKNCDLRHYCKKDPASPVNPENKKNS